MVSLFCNQYQCDLNGWINTKLNTCLEDNKNEFQKRVLMRGRKVEMDNS